MRKRILIWVGLCVIFVFATSTVLMGTERKSESEMMGVMVTIFPLVDFVENVGKDKVEVTVMVPPGVSPHTYEPTPSQLRELSKAKIYVKVGSGVEFELVWMNKLIEVNKNMLICDSSRGVQLMGKDPHIWLSPLNAKIQVENIYEALVKIDPTNKEYYAQNKENYLKKLDELDRKIGDGLSGIKNRKFMVFHPAWGYFARDYDLEQIPIEKEGKEPTARGLAKIIKQAKTNSITVVFVSPQFSTESAETIAKEIGGRVAFINPLARDYVTNMHTVLDELVQGLK